ncbi:MAG: universal stress protein [Oceanicaulis sp.]
MTRITAFIDASAYTESVADHAAWVSRTTGYGLDLVHTANHHRRAAPVDMTGNLSLGARSSLMDTLTRHDAEAAKLARQAGAAVLDAAKAHAEAAGAVDVQTKLRTGEVLEAVRDLEAGSRLLVLGKRGEHADFAAGHLGSNLERVVRAAHRPVLVASRAFKQPGHAVIAFDGGASVGKAVSHIAEGKLFGAMKLTLLYAGRREDGLDAEMEAAAAILTEAGHEVEMVFTPGEPEKVIAGHMTETGADLLVMGAYGHSRIRTLIIGSTTTEMVRACKTPVMLFRPEMG